MSIDSPRPVVVKVGGSLFDLPGLGQRLHLWLRQDAPPNVVLVPGGGELAEAVRKLDRAQHLGEEHAHLLALGAVSVAASFLAALLPDGQVIPNLKAAAGCWKRGALPILDLAQFDLADRAQPGHLPHVWDVTSDSLALRAAIVAGAWRLILLKSVPLPANADWNEVSRQGIVDRYFPKALAAAKLLDVQALNFRDWEPR